MHQLDYETAKAPTSAEAFSRYAPAYDAEQQGNLLARWQRKESLRVLAHSFKPGSRVLEIGCGTGEEALFLARRGLRVLATDAAPGMVEELDRKIVRLSPEDAVRSLIKTRVLAASQIGHLVSEFGYSSFDGAYSSFGPLNCEPDLAPIVASLGELVRPGGRLVISVINRYCIWEALWHLAKLQPSTAFRRWGGRSLATVREEWQGSKVPVYYWTPRTLERTFSPDFSLLHTRALTWALPPPYLSARLTRHRWILAILERLEKRFASRWPFRALGDHVLLVLERRR